MSDRIVALAYALASGDDDEAYARLIAAIADPEVTLEALLELTHSANERIRDAVLAGSHRRSEPAFVARVRELVDDPSQAVRYEVARGAAINASWLEDAQVERLLADESAGVRHHAVTAALARPALVPSLLQLLAAEPDARLRRNTAMLLRDADASRVVCPLFHQLATDSETRVQQACAQSLESLCATLGSLFGELPQPPPKVLREVLARLEKLNAGAFPHLHPWIEGVLRQLVDLDELGEQGELLTTPTSLCELPRAFGRDEPARAIVEILTGSAPRAVVVLGDSGTGKTALVHEVVHRLAAQGWHVLQRGASAFVAGQTYFGQWEGALTTLVKLISAPRKVVLYVPDVALLSQVGTTHKSDANVASMLAPFIARGEIALLGEGTPEEFERAWGAHPSLKRIFVALRLEPATADETHAILRDICESAGVAAADAVLRRHSEVVGFVDTVTAEPGRSAAPLRRLLQTRSGAGGAIDEKELLSSVAATTGVPLSILDDSVPLDRGAVRTFFESRVMGQAEAVSVLVDLVTMVKAGLTDPGRPFGVFLFVGPTGVGKTELARALAECLFGDRDRMVRIDLSEYATSDAHERLLGSHGDPGTLTAPVQDKPFSVVLLDEIEKGNVNVLDLCLQLFDAGRLTDSTGRVVDFRRTIIILTSNIGSHFDLQAKLGFGRESSGAPTDDRILREVRRAMRPEFLNRIDRIVVFRPLDADTAAKIAQREVLTALARNGIKRRRLAVDVDPSVLSLLLEKGYSEAYGARPLKRTVERLVVLPVAEVVAKGSAPAGSVLRLVASSSRVRVDITAPAAEPAPPRPRPERASRAGALARGLAWSETLAALRDEARALAERRAVLLARKTEPEFWPSPGSASVLDEIYRLEGVLDSIDALAEACRDEALLARPAEVAMMDARIGHLQGLVSSPTLTDLGDAFVLVRRVPGERHGLDPVAQFARMLLGYAPRHGAIATVIDDRPGGADQEDAVGISITGVGAFALFQAEGGLHELVHRSPPKRRPRHADEEIAQTVRELVRVEVIPALLDDDPPRDDEFRVEVRRLSAPTVRLLKPTWEVRVVHQTTNLPVELHTDGTRAQALQRSVSLSRALVRAREASAGMAPLVTTIRRYSTGVSPRARDLRTDRSTARVGEVLAGDLDLLRDPTR